MKQYTVTIVILVIVTILSTMWVSSLPSIDIPNIDKPVHFAMYAILTMAIFMDHTRWLRKPGNKWIYLIAPLIAICYGGLMELVQALLPWRGCSIWDFLANSIGAVIATAIYFVIDIVRKKR